MAEHPRYLDAFCRANLCRECKSLVSAVTRTAFRAIAVAMKRSAGSPAIDKSDRQDRDIARQRHLGYARSKQLLTQSTGWLAGFKPAPLNQQRDFPEAMALIASWPSASARSTTDRLCFPSELSLVAIQIAACVSSRITSSHPIQRRQAR